MSYSAAAVGAPFVTIIPVVNLWAGIFPLVITKPIAVLGTFYLLAANGVIFYAPAELGESMNALRTAILAWCLPGLCSKVCCLAKSSTALDI